MPAATTQPSAHAAASRQVCRTVLTVRGWLMAASLQASMLALKFFSACVTTGFSFSLAHSSFRLFVYFSTPRAPCLLLAKDAPSPYLHSTRWLARSRSTPVPRRSAAEIPFAAARSSSLQSSKPASPVPAPAIAAPRSVRRSATTPRHHPDPPSWFAYAARIAAGGFASGPFAD